MAISSNANYNPLWGKRHLRDIRALSRGRQWHFRERRDSGYSESSLYIGRNIMKGREKSLEGRVALVTARARGIGRAFALALGHERFGHIDILINNAGLGAPNPAEAVTEGDFDETIAVNLKGTFFTAQAVGRLMIARKYGGIVNISSQAGFAALPKEPVYCMTKAVISHLMKCLASNGRTRASP